MLGLNPNLCKVKLHLRAFEVIPWKPSLVKACCTYVGWAIPFLRITGGRLERAVWLAFGPQSSKIPAPRIAPRLLSSGEPEIASLP